MQAEREHGGLFRSAGGGAGVARSQGVYAQTVGAGYQPDTAPRDAQWGERYFHVTDPDGHELSFARPCHDVPEAGGRPHVSAFSRGLTVERHWSPIPL